MKNVIKTTVEILTEPTGQSECQEFPNCTASYDADCRELTIVDLENTVIEVFVESELIIRVTMEFQALDDVIKDREWKPANDEQAEARLKR